MAMAMAGGSAEVPRLSSDIFRMEALTSAILEYLEVDKDWDASRLSHEQIACIHPLHGVDPPLGTVSRYATTIVRIVDGALRDYVRQYYHLDPDEVVFGIDCELLHIRHKVYSMMVNKNGNRARIWTVWGVKRWIFWNNHVTLRKDDWLFFMLRNMQGVILVMDNNTRFTVTPKDLVDWYIVKFVPARFENGRVIPFDSMTERRKQSGETPDRLVDFIRRYAPLQRHAPTNRSL